MVSPRSDGQRERILRAAVQLFSQRGYHATSLKQLASRAGMTAPNLYHYYRSKEEILFEVHSIQLVKLIDRQTEIIDEAPDPAARLYALAYNMVWGDLQDPLAGFVPSNQLTGLRGANAKAIRGYMKTIRGHWQDTVEDGVHDGLFAVGEPRLVTLHALTLCSYAPSWFDPKGEFAAHDVATTAAQSCLRIVGCTVDAVAWGVGDT